MRITKVELRNFKRFTDLTIDGIPADTKLVLLIGSNGSGKSSVFDAFESINGSSREGGQSESEAKSSQNYLRKINSEKEEISLTLSDSMQRLKTDSFYGRSSFRQVSRLTRRQSAESFSMENDADRPRSYIDRDNRFENDIDRVSGQILRELFRDNGTADQIRSTYIGTINRAFENIFSAKNNTALSLFEIIPPLEGKPAQVNFRKGASEIPYDYLSAGEKEVFNILLNLLVRKDQYTDTVYFFDEIDLHLNTQLQFNLLKEITENWIPENCQFWTASHSLGFIDYARKYDKGVIIDFDDLDFDQPQTLLPQPKEQLDIYDIAVPKEMLFEIMKGKRVIVCENQNDEFYNLLALPNIIFVGMKDARSVFLQVKTDSRYQSIRDRDFLSDTEIERIRIAYPNHHILQYYAFENYLYHPDNIAEVNPTGFDKQAYIAELIRQKNERLLYRLPSLTSARQTYEEFKTDEKLKDKSTDSIVDDLRSDELERFYKFFDVKVDFKKSYLVPFGLSKERLVKTHWFRQNIEAFLSQ